MHPSPLRIGTRRSNLATWQAEAVRRRLQAAGIESELVFIATEGDRVLDKPLPLIGGKGVFTKALDDALLAEEIDLAVHSYKDIPTRLPAELHVGAILPRADWRDALVLRSGDAFLTSGESVTIATGSNRRRGQWLRRFPHHSITGIRGNVNTRLSKLAVSNWGGAVFAAAGLQRLGMAERIGHFLEWMLPAPAQGAIAVMIRTGDDARFRAALAQLHDPPTARCTAVERQLLNRLEGGCSAPLGVLAREEQGQIHIRSILVALTGEPAIERERRVSAGQWERAGEDLAEAYFAAGAGELLQHIEAENARIHGGQAG